MSTATTSASATTTTTTSATTTTERSRCAPSSGCAGDVPPLRTPRSARRLARESRPQGCRGTILWMNVYVMALLGLVAGCSTAGGTADAGQTRAPWCPQTLPEAGTPCQPTPLSTPSVYAACEYGDNPHCTSVATCSSPGATNSQMFSWFVSPPDPACAGNGPYCPAGIDASTTPGCPASATCTYAGGRCFCVACVSGPPSCGGNQCVDQDGGTQWSCDAWQQPPDCPMPRPLLGTSCNVAGQMCGGGPDPVMTCAEGYWVVPIEGC